MKIMHMKNTQRNGFSIAKLVIVIAIIAVLLVAMFIVVSAAQTNWQQKWDDMVVSKAKDTKAVFIDKGWDPSSSQMNPAMLIDNEGEINEILAILEDISFTKTEDYELHELSDKPIGAEYRLILMHDDIEKDSSSSVIGNTGSIFSDELTLYIDNVGNDWYALIVVFNGVGYDVYRSNVKADLAELGEMYEAFSYSQNIDE